jgi:hypothetical protein
MKIRPGDRVLEIGSGHNPHPRSDVLCDRCIEDDSERGGRLVADRPIVEGDAQALPFRDGAFDYVICAHVLEHVENPGEMLRELMRVASRGYIETPSEIAERLYGWPFHRSVVHVVDGRLVIRPKDFTPPFGELFHVLAARDPAFRRFHRSHGGLLLVRFEWEGRIEYEVAPANSAAVDLTSAEAAERLWREARRTAWREGWRSRVRDLLPESWVRQAKAAMGARSAARRRIDLRDVVACPRCKGPVQWDRTRIVCPSCHAEYPIVAGIPRLAPA